ncbi:MAG TPA: Flp pilus assembly protein CpaB [Phenylobacterium sp.]|nr:Flp pilus assembly protein CpaB [Phenylobacterium sp.]
MRLVTIGSLGASAALGLGALLVAKVLMPAAASNQVQAAPVIMSPMANAVSVVVAATDIPFGHKLEAGDLKLIRVPRDAAPADAFRTVGSVLAQDHGGAPIALTPMAAREPLLPAKLSGPGARQSVAAEIATGMRAYAIAVNDVSSVGGHALPGDRVDVVLMRNIAPEDAEKKILRSEVVIQNVRLLGVGLNADPTSTKAETAATATLEVSVKDAQKLAIAADLGTLSLALRGTGMAEVEQVAPLASAEIGGAAPGRSGPYRPRSAAAGGSRIQIVEGEGQSPKSSAAAPNS